MKMNTPRTKLSLAVVAVSMMGMAHAEEIQELSTSVVEAENEASVSHTVREISADEINRKSLSNIEDTTRYIPGVQVNDAGNRFGDNGFNIRGLQGDAVAVSVDGVSMGETLAPASFSAYGMYDSTRGQVELQHVKAITVTKGPSSVKNGSNALAGSVAYTTNDASDFLEDGDDTTIQFKNGIDTRSDELMLGLTLANRTGDFETLLQYTHRDGSETKAHSSGKSVSDPASATEVADSFSIKTDSVLAKFAYLIDDNQRVGILLDQTDRYSEGSPLSRESASYYDFSTEDANNKTRYGIFYDWNNAKTPVFDSLSATLDYQELYTSGVTSFGYSTRSGDSYLRQEDRSTYQDSVALNLDFGKSFGSNVIHDLVYGVSFEQRTIENIRWDRRYNDLSEGSGYQDGYPERDSAWVPVTKTNRFNAYVSDTMQLTDAFSLSAGVRYDLTKYKPETDDTFEDATDGQSVKDSEYSAFVGELIAEYEFIPNNFLLASYSQGYKGASAQQLYLGTNGADVLTDTTGAEHTDLDTVANPDLGAEKSSSIELGYKLEAERASVTVTAYHTVYEDMIQNVSRSVAYDEAFTVEEYNYYTGTTTEVTYTEDDYSVPENVGKVEVQGLELDASYAITNNIYSRLTFATIDGEYKDDLEGSHDKGDALETAAPDSGTLTLGYQGDNDKWGIALHTLWFDKIEEQTQPDADDASVVAGDLSFTSLNNGSGPAHYPEAYTVFDLTAFYDISENISLSAAAYNLTDKEYYRWEVLNSIRPGNGGFFGGVSEDGYKRYSEPGRSYSLNLTMTF
ncbi:MAG: TonB-dependent receptor [Thalassolituus sp.]|nr:MAG: TonB-dependent receptor [Thalassolituus sp.]